MQLVGHGYWRFVNIIENRMSENFESSDRLLVELGKIMQTLESMMCCVSTDVMFLIG